MCLFYSFKYNFLDEISDVDPSSLKPAEKLEWNLSPDSVRDIDEAKHTIDKCVCVVFVCLSVCLSVLWGRRKISTISANNAVPIHMWSRQTKI